MGEIELDFRRPMPLIVVKYRCLDKGNFWWFDTCDFSKGNRTLTIGGYCEAADGNPTEKCTIIFTKAEHDEDEADCPGTWKIGDEVELSPPNRNSGVGLRC